MLEKVLDSAFKKQKAVCLIGSFGIGKSHHVYDWVKTKAKELGKELKIWHLLSEEEKINILEELEDFTEKKLKKSEKYFIFVDIKLQSVGDVSKITGIPVILNHNAHGTKVVWQPPLFVKALTKCAGCFFLDEINMALPSMQSSSFEIAQQRKVGEWALGEDVMIIIAGNPLKNNISANAIPKPLINRMLLKKLNCPEENDWIKDFAMPHEIDYRIVSFVKLFGEMEKIDENEEDIEQSTTPRSYENMSDMIKDSDDLYYIRECADGYLHPSTASKFIKFCQSMEDLDYSKYIKDFERFKNAENQVKYAVITLIAKHFKEIKIEDFVDFLKDLAKHILELGAVLLSLIKLKHSQPAIRKIVPLLAADEISRLVYLIEED